MSDVSELPPIIAGRYRPVRLLGRGGMGTVYLVEHVHTGEHLALKVMHLGPTATAEKIERFKREARVSARIKSEHVVRVTDADVSAELGGVPFLVMELLEGADLAQHCGPQAQSPVEVVTWLRQVAKALDKAHKLGLVHRDLKPENLFLARRDDGSPLIKILDFGLVKPISGSEPGSTHTGEILGTPLFMAPEQARGEIDKVGPHTDLWSLGLCAFRLLVGHDYWTATAITQLLGQIVYDPMAPASARGATFGPAFDAWFAKACAREPAERFTSAGEQVEALAEALGLPRISLQTSGSGEHSPSGQHEVAYADTIEASKRRTGTTDGAVTAVSAGASKGGGARRWWLLAVAVGVVGTVGAAVTLRSTPPPTTSSPALSSAPPLPTSAPVLPVSAPEPTASSSPSAPPASASAPPASASAPPASGAAAKQPPAGKREPPPARPPPAGAQKPRPLDDQF